MNDRYRDQFDDDPTRAADMDAVTELDRLLDAVASGVHVGSGDPVLSLMAAARSELDAAGEVPPPDVRSLPATVTPLGRHRRRRRLGFFGRAAATSGISVTGMVVASGVAAAIAVGGFSVAAFHGAIPGIPAHREVEHPVTTTIGGQTSISYRSKDPVTTGRADDEPVPAQKSASVGPTVPVDPTDATVEPTVSLAPPEPQPATEETAEPTETEVPTDPADPTEPTRPSTPSTDKNTPDTRSREPSAELEPAARNIVYGSVD